VHQLRAHPQWACGTSLGRQARITVKKTPCREAGGNGRQLLCPSNHGNNYSFSFVGCSSNFGINIFLDCILDLDISPLKTN
jgi:hypothetical protein